MSFTGAVRTYGAVLPQSLGSARAGAPAATPTHRFTEPGTAVADGHAPAVGAILVLAVWLLAFGSYAVLSYRRTAGNI